MITQPARLGASIAASVLIAVGVNFVFQSSPAMGNASALDYAQASATFRDAPPASAGMNPEVAAVRVRHRYERLEVKRYLAVRRAHRLETRQDAAQAAAAAAAAAAARQAARQQARQQAAAAPTTAPSGNVSTGGFSSFEACVINAESGGDPTAYNSSSGASGLFGFLLSTWMNTPEGASYPGGAYTAPASVQEQAFAWVYARDGTAPWAPYDGC